MWNCAKYLISSSLLANTCPSAMGTVSPDIYLPAKKLRELLKTVGADRCSVRSESLDNMLDGELGIPPPDLRIPRGGTALTLLDNPSIGTDRI